MKLTSGNLQDNEEVILPEAPVSWKKNGNLTPGQPNLISMDHEPAQGRGKNRSPASPDSSNGFIPQLIEELLRLNQGTQGNITPHVLKEGRCFDAALCRCLTRKGWQS